jgi:hypothetical protein
MLLMLQILVLMLVMLLHNGQASPTAVTTPLAEVNAETVSTAAAVATDATANEKGLKFSSFP